MKTSAARLTSLTPSNRSLLRKAGLRPTVAILFLLAGLCFSGTALTAQTTFGSLAIGSSYSNDVYITINADGTAQLPIVMTLGATGLDFTDTGSGSCTSRGAGYRYSPGDTCYELITFSPKHPGLQMGGMQRLDSLGNIVASASFYGIGTGPQITYSPGTQTTLGSGFSFPAGIAVDGKGNVYVADHGNNAVKEISSGNSVTTLGSGFSAPTDVAVDGSGNVFVSDFNNNAVKEIVAVGGVIPASPTILTLGSGFSGPAAVAVDQYGNVYVADANNNAIKEIVAVGGVIPTSPTILTLASGFSSNGIAVDASGNVYVADINNNAVKEIVAVGGTIPSNPTILTLSSSFSNPWNFALDATGSLFVADAGSNSIKKIVAVSGVIPASPTVLTVASGFNYPLDVAVDGSGNLYVADFENNAVRKLNYATAPNLNFATTTNVGSSDTTDGPQTVTIINNGNASLNFTLPTSGNNPSISSGFAYNAASTCPQLSANSSAYSLAAGASCTYVLDFLPTAAGSNNGSLVLTDNALNVSGTTQTVSLAGTGASGPTTVNLAVSPNPSLVGQSITYTATVSSASGPTPTGTVQILNGSTVLSTGSFTASGTLNSGVATFTSPSGLSGSLPGGTYNLTAVYSGDSNYAPSTSALVVGVVNPSVTTTTLSLFPTTGNVTTQFNFSGQVSCIKTPTGTYSLQDGTQPSSGPLTLTNSGFSSPYATFNRGSHSIVATFNGDNNCAASTSSPLNFTVAGATTTLSVAANPVFPTLGQSVTVTASLRCSLNSTYFGPDGTVSFYVGSTLLGSSPVSTIPANGTGTATLTTSAFPQGSYSLQAVYSGGQYCNTASTTIVNTLSPSTTTLSSNLSNVVPGQAVTLTATVSGSGATPTGTVTFSATSTGASQGVLATVPVVNGVATYYGLIWTGTDVVTAAYNGGSTYSGSTSNSLNIFSGSLTGKLQFNWPYVNWSQGTNIGSCTSPWPVTLQNLTGVTVATPTLSFSGAYAADFSISANTCTTALTQGATCTFNIGFCPTVGGSANGSQVSASLTASTATSTNYSNSLTVSGVAITNSLTFNWPFLNFTPTVSVGNTSNAWLVTLTNQSSTATTLASPAVTFTDASFTRSSDTCSGATLAAGASCTFSVSFSPLAADIVQAGNNVISASMTASGNSGAVTGSLPVSGWGAAALGFNWPFVTFPGQPQGSTGSNPWPVTVTNYSGQSLSSITYTLTGATNYASGAFTLTNTCSTLAPGASCTFDVAPSPLSSQTANAYSATLVVAGNGLSSPALSISGSVITGGYSINWNQDQQGGVSTIDFGPQNTANATAGPWPITVYNNTAVTESIAVNPSLSVFTTSGSTCSSVAPGGACTFNLYFTPTADQYYNGTLAITGGTYTCNINTWGGANK